VGVALLLLLGLPAAQGEDEEETRPEREPSSGGELTIARREEPSVPLPDCKECGNTGQVKAEPPKQPYVLFENDPPPDPWVRLGWKPCASCPRGQKQQPIYETERARLASRDKEYQDHEDRVGMKFVDFETPLVTGHFQTTAQEARQCGQLFARLAGVLKDSGAGVFLPDTPNLLHLVVCENEEQFGKYLEYFSRFVEGRDADWVKLAKTSASFGSRFLSVIRRDRVVSPSGSSLPNLAVFCLGHMLVGLASGGRAPDWFSEGFSSYCESCLFTDPRCYSIRYEENPLEFESSWSRAVWNGLRAGKALPWAKAFGLDLIAMTRLEYQQCWSIVRYLATLDKEAFARLPGLFIRGLKSAEALEKAYNKPLSKLEGDWRYWAGQRP
jgi:hypothetical protein